MTDINIKFNDIFNNFNFLIADDTYFYLFVYHTTVLNFMEQFDYNYLIGRALDDWYVLDEDLRFEHKLREPIFINEYFDIILVDDMGVSGELKLYKPE